MSKSIKIMGGAVQGSILGVMDYNAVLEDLDCEIDGANVQKYVDDATVLEDVLKTPPRVIKNDKKVQLGRAIQTENAFEKVSDACEKRT